MRCIRGVKRGSVEGPEPAIPCRQAEPFAHLVLGGARFLPDRHGIFDELAGGGRKDRGGEGEAQNRDQDCQQRAESAGDHFEPSFMMFSRRRFRLPEGAGGSVAYRGIVRQRRKGGTGAAVRMLLPRGEAVHAGSG